MGAQVILQVVIPWLTYEPEHDKTIKQSYLYAHWRLRSAWASAQLDQSLHCLPEEGLGP